MASFPEISLFGFCSYSLLLLHCGVFQILWWICQAVSEYVQICQIGQICLASIKVYHFHTFYFGLSDIISLPFYRGVSISFTNLFEFASAMLLTRTSPYPAVDNL